MTKAKTSVYTRGHVAQKSSVMPIIKLVRNTVFLLVWVFLGFFFGQFIFSFIFVFLLHEASTQPFWSMLSSALSSISSLFLIIYIPHKFPCRWSLWLAGLSSVMLVLLLLLLWNVRNEFDFFCITVVVSVLGIIVSLPCWNKLEHVSCKKSMDKTLTTAPTHKQQVVASEKNINSDSCSLAITNREQLGFAGLPTWTDIGLAPIGYVVALILGAVLVAIFSVLMPWFDASEVQDVGFNAVYSIGDRIFAFVALVIVAPIAEETIFRGWLYGKLRSYLNLPVALILVSLLFGLMHGQWNVGLTVFAMSAVMCFTREITGTIYAGIIMHMLKNGIAFILLYVVNMV